MMATSVDRIRMRLRFRRTIHPRTLHDRVRSCVYPRLTAGSLLRQMKPMPPEPIQRVSRLAPLPEIHARIDAVAAPVAVCEVEVSQAYGRILAADASVAASVPRRPLALRDGFAVDSERVSDARPYAPVPLEPAPAWVECGDPMPDGSDAVLAPDAVTLAGGMAEAHGAAAPGDHVLPAGADAEAGRVLRRAG